MPIELSDIPTAVSDYLDNQVTTTISAVTPDVSSSLEPGEEGTFTVSVRNAAAPDGVRLVNVKYHLTISPASVAKLKVPGSAILTTRSGTSPTSPQLTRNSLVNEMVVFPMDPTGLHVIDVGQTDELIIKMSSVAVGTATINCHIHADIDEASLFPTGQNSPNGVRQLTVS